MVEGMAKEGEEKSARWARVVLEAVLQHGYLHLSISALSPHFEIVFNAGLSQHGFRANGFTRL